MIIERASTVGRAVFGRLRAEGKQALDAVVMGTSNRSGSATVGDLPLQQMPLPVTGIPSAL